ncbi:uncharacterized protein C1orf131 homolog [Pelobates fuscus]|uniref:uncharacterized protein C1orf131 homolog n=1 Tax=Pelobates fuscus TaxID=191477 RepID=UPI002FE4E303
MEDAQGYVEVQDQLNSLLSDLYDFGDNFVHRDKTKTKRVAATQKHNSLKKPDDGGNVGELNECLASSKSHSKSKTKNALMFFKSIKDELRDKIDLTDTPSAEPNGVSCSEQGEPNVEVVTFSSYRKKKKAKVESNVEPQEGTETSLEEKDADETKHMFNLEKARLEVHKFGITGYKKEKQRLFEKERAIMLGAKPPKREYLNYKVYQEKRAARKEDSRMENSLEASSKKLKRGHGERKTKKVKNSGGIIPTGHVGKFKNGALFLSVKDIKMIKQSKVIK